MIEPHRFITVPKNAMVSLWQKKQLFHLPRSLFLTMKTSRLIAYAVTKRSKKNGHGFFFLSYQPCAVDSLNLVSHSTTFSRQDDEGTPSVLSTPFVDPNDISAGGEKNAPFRISDSFSSLIFPTLSNLPRNMSGRTTI